MPMRVDDFLKTHIQSINGTMKLISAKINCSISNPLNKEYLSQNKNKDDEDNINDDNDLQIFANNYKLKK